MAEPVTTAPVLANATPLRQFDWCAYRDGENRMVGYGATEAEALADFQRLEDEDYCSTKCPAESRDGEDCSLNGGCLLLRKDCPRGGKCATAGDCPFRRVCLSEAPR